jgi:serine/threonine protein kinase
VSTSERLSDLLLQWKDLQAQGKILTPEEMCADCPELTEELRRRIRIIRTMEQMLGQSPDRSSMTTAAAGPPRSSGTLPDSLKADLEKIRIPGYELLGVIDRGGMGVVYKAVQTQLKRTVALKMILGGVHAGPQQLSRFRTEAEAIARLQHPHIVQIYDVGESEGKPFFTMEFVPGGNLAQNMEAYRLPPGSGSSKSAPTKSGDRKDRQERVDRLTLLVETLARTIQVAHERGIVHRDLKPANILLTPDGSPKITDFGLAKRLDAASQNTNTGAILGTPSYMAPEQASGKTRVIGPATDIYALGAILYELLTGRPPFKGETSIETLMGVMSEDAIPPSKLQRSVPRNLESICMKCLEKKPQHRYASAAELADDLHRFRNDLPINAKQIGLLRRGVRWVRRHPVVTLMALFLAIGGVAFASMRVQREDPRVEAVRVAPEVKHILKHYCFECHGLNPAEMGRDLNVLDYDALLKESRPQVVPGRPEASRLLKRILDESMPPKSGDGEEMPRLSLDEQQVLKTWIAGGAPRFPDITEEDMVPQTVAISPLAAQVKEIFIKKCRGCHSPEETGGGIRIINHDMLVNKREVVVPGNPEASELFRLIAYTQEPVMPPREKDKDGKVIKENRLSDAEVAIIRQWIEEGAAEFPRSREKK